MSVLISSSTYLVILVHNPPSSSLARIENSMIKALERQEVSKETVEIADELTPVTRSQTAPAAVTSEDLSEASDGLGLRGIQRAFTGATLIDPGADPSADLTPPVSDDEVSEYGSPKATSSKSKPMSAGKMRKASTFSVGRDAKALPPSPLASDEYCEESPQKARLRGKLSPAGDRKGKGLRPSSVVEAVADAMQELSKVRQKEQSARPLRVVREDPVHQADKTLKERFQQLAEDELRIRSLNAKDWLRVATWWLLKV